MISKDLCLVLYPRGDATSRLRLSLRNLFHSHHSLTRSSTIEPTHCISAVYQLKLRRSNRIGTSPGMERRQRKVIDTSKIYVRGEEMLNGWRPRSDSLILEHQLDLEKLYKIECVSVEQDD